MKLSWDQLTPHLKKKASDIVERNAMQFFRDIVRVWPVDTGRSRAAWKIEEIATARWLVSNNVNYSQYLWVGLPVGSKQLPNGGQPILNATVRKLERELRELV